MRAVDFVRSCVASEGFRSSILVLIVLNALALGVEATPELEGQFYEWLGVFFLVSQAIFVLEILARIAAHGSRPGQFFADSWNRFDFAIVAASLLPAVGAVSLAARVLRVLRLVRLASVSSSLRGSLLRKERGLRAVGLALVLVALVWYVLALVGFHLFGDASPERWGTLAAALASLLQVPQGLGPTALWLLFLAALASTASNLVRALRPQPSENA